MLSSVTVSAFLQGVMALGFLGTGVWGRAGEHCRVSHDCAGVGLTHSFIVWPFFVLAVIGGGLAALLSQRVSALRTFIAACWLGSSWSYVMYWTWPFLVVR